MDMMADLTPPPAHIPGLVVVVLVSLVELVVVEMLLMVVMDLPARLVVQH